MLTIDVVAFLFSRLYGHATPKVGAKVTVHYRVTGRGKAIATQIEKTESGAQKKSTD